MRKMQAVGTQAKGRQKKATSSLDKRKLNTASNLPKALMSLCSTCKKAALLHFGTDAQNGNAASLSLICDRECASMGRVQVVSIHEAFWSKV